MVYFAKNEHGNYVEISAAQEEEIAKRGTLRKAPGYAVNPIERHQEENKRNGNECPSVVRETGSIWFGIALTCIGCSVRLA